MEEVLDLYALAPDPSRPLVNLDEFSKQLLSEVAPPKAARPASANRAGTPRRHDSEYVREGSASAFMIAAPHLGLREVFVGEEGRRTALDYAAAIEFMCDVMFPEAEKIVLVQDNLNTHNPASLYKAFPAQKARRLASKIQWHHTPKHGSWLNIAECELSAMSKQCLSGRRIGHLSELQSEIAAWADNTNQKQRVVDWQFQIDDARTRLKHLYPKF